VKDNNNDGVLDPASVGVNGVGYQCEREPYHVCGRRVC
jgi:hypothetical protein